MNAIAAVGVAITVALATAAGRRGIEPLTWRGRSDVTRIVEVMGQNFASHAAATAKN